MLSPDMEPQRAEAYQRLRQQELIAEFGLFALRGDSLQPSLDEVCRVAADGLDVPFAKVLRFLPGENAFLVQAGVGWHAGVVGHARLGADLESPAGYAFRTGRPVISNHLTEEARFRTPALLMEHGVKRALNVLIGSGQSVPYGVLEVDSGDRTDFEPRDIAFLQSLANVIAAVVDRQARQVALARSEAMLQSVFESSPDCIKVLRGDGTLLRMNHNGLCLMEIDDFSKVANCPWERLWPGEQVEHVRAAINAARQTGIGHFEAFCPTARGTPKWWDVLVAPLGGTGEDEQFVAISRDVTDRVKAVEAKDALLRQQDLLMREVHHRIRNSLQLVHTLLQLQAGHVNDGSARAHLGEAARRVLTIAAVHKRLYEGSDVTEADLATYLGGLLEDLRGSLSDESAGRHIRLSTESLMLSPDKLTSLGLIVTELVTNALKYGHGTVSVTVQPLGGMARIEVEDEGRGFPEDFDPVRSRGLGMRLLLTLARKPNGIRVDRSVPWGRIVVEMPLG
ncbi:sensor histidine kinase [Roseomonas gilardii]|uniref:sensor histidine kinase n=1 Tax=Roseomonas gilardii TaxID=257708 RepID=UPI00048003D4|nr:histidine kinase dimerization/phosphoacceptor domain -containing protein [Roseomonas gilardii]SUE42643.1 Probable sensor histidine kinase pdtaS [Roseomonas gilardii subsp. rosea]